MFSQRSGILRQTLAMTVRVRILPLNAPGKGEQHGFRALKLVRTELEFEEGAHACKQFGAVHGTSQEVISPRLDTFNAILFVRERRNQNYGYQISFRIGLDFLAGLKAVEMGHHDVKEHQIDWNDGQLFQGGCAV